MISNIRHDLKFPPPYWRILPMLDPAIQEVQAATPYAPSPDPRTINNLIAGQIADNPGCRSSGPGYEFEHPRRPNRTQPHTNKFHTIH